MESKIKEDINLKLRNVNNIAPEQDSILYPPFQTPHILTTKHSPSFPPERPVRAVAENTFLSASALPPSLTSLIPSLLRHLPPHHLLSSTGFHHSWSLQATGILHLPRVGLHGLVEQPSHPLHPSIIVTHLGNLLAQICCQWLDYCELQIEL